MERTIGCSFLFTNSMPTPGTDPQRVTLIAIAVTAVALGAFGLRLVSAATVTANKPLPAADIQSLSAFLGPLPDSTSLAGSSTGTMVVDRDPFGSTAPTSLSAPRSAGTASSRSTKIGGQQWVVSSILFEDSRRSAIVNNAWVGVGDPLGGGARVTAIERKHVVVTDANGIRHVVPIQGGAQ
jgi:hypothetical protein